MHYKSWCNKSWKGMPEEKILQASSENRHRGCGHDMLRQTVPSASGVNREGPITDSGQPCTTDSQRWWGGGAQLYLGLIISRALELIGEVRNYSVVWFYNISLRNCDVSSYGIAGRVHPAGDCTPAGSHGGGELADGAQSERSCASVSSACSSKERWCEIGNSAAAEQREC